MRNFPVFRLRVTTPRLELRLPSLGDLDDLADLAIEGVHDPELMPFLFPWTDAEPARRANSAIQFHFRQWAAWTPEKWTCPFAVVFEGQVAGVQEVAGADFAVTREVSTGSWLGRRFHGRGIGTEMRAAVLHLAFDGLGALTAASGAFTDNHASLAVSRKLGYRDDGVDVHNRRGERAETQRLRLSRDDWTTPPGFGIHGLGPCLPLFGVGRTEGT
ncbi:GNAT family N-acetyltransferase [Planomonospora sp. ID67723]|uniref:GNAT family N-acetyltransferase n=1 Tax=Planomonospora sp. ID67723 TaxID=2738134 RepID=UPI0018C3C71D|nr:GNAT family protein [Planomonospora sp. ID67723]MBG0828103.1 GNAT family N-acetyltransferase [Planomonospora sp. ID67723]